MNGKALFFFLIAIGCGTGAAVFANNWLKQQAGDVLAEPGIATTPVVAAVSDIPYGSVIEAIQVKVVQWPSDSLPASSVTDPELVVGKLANQQILAGEPILESRAVEQLTGSALSALIAPNKRAHTVRVDDVAGVAGFLLPGNRVDVLGARKLRNSSSWSTRTVLQNLKVLAVDQKASTDKDDPVVVRAVTVEVDLDESLELMKATQEGKVHLVLRNPEDLSERITPPKTIAAVPRRRAPPPTVRIIRGVSSTNSTVAN